MTWRTAPLHFAREHPAAPGHFPGDPVVPGALLLDAVIAAIAGGFRDAPMLIRSAKFLRIVRPGESLALRWQKLPDGGVGFECWAEDALAVTGRLQFTAGP